MSHSKHKTASRRNDVPAVVYLSAFGLGLLSYAVGRVALDGKPHPLHWLIALAGGLGGMLIGWLRYRLHGDVF